MANKPFKFRFANELAGGLILLALLIIGGSLAMSGQVRELFTRRTTITLNLPAEGSLGLKEGADVVILGTPVGRVAAIDIEDNGRMTATLSVRSDFVRFISADTKAVIRKAQLIGDAYVEIPRKSGPPLPVTGATMETSEDRATAELAETLLNDLRAEALPALKNIRAAAEEYTNLAKDLQNPEGDLKQAIARFSRVADAAEQGDGLIARLLKDKALADQIASSGPKVNTALDETNSVLKHLNKTSAALPEMATTANEQLKQLPALVKQMEQTLAEVQVVLRDLQKSTSQLPDTVKSINQTVQGLPSLVLQSQETMRQMQRLAESAQKSWLIGGGGGGETDTTGRIAPDRVGGSR
jgi:phospholipid/cholesterol/gamma-HCH transport system substrate-binding protein